MIITRLFFKFSYLLCIFALAPILSSCSGTKPSNNTPTPAPQPDPIPTPSTDSIITSITSIENGEDYFDGSTLTYSNTDKVINDSTTTAPGVIVNLDEELEIKTNSNGTKNDNESYVGNNIILLNNTVDPSSLDINYDDISTASLADVENIMNIIIPSGYSYNTNILLGTINNSQDSKIRDVKYSSLDFYGPQISTESSTITYDFYIQNSNISISYDVEKLLSGENATTGYAHINYTKIPNKSLIFDYTYNG